MIASALAATFPGGVPADITMAAADPASAAARFLVVTQRNLERRPANLERPGRLKALRFQQHPPQNVRRDHVPNGADVPHEPVGGCQ